MKIIFTILLLCSFAVNAGSHDFHSQINPECGVYLVTPAGYAIVGENIYIIHFYCFSTHGYLTIGQDYVTVDDINRDFNNGKV